MNVGFERSGVDQDLPRIIVVRAPAQTDPAAILFAEGIELRNLYRVFVRVTEGNAKVEVR